ncbi:MAG: hypothetical protein D3918_08315 [Candidatus Electrothrix sp. AX2]|nr:hypothetical protein [Candidatus Electrothrix gigas]
MNISDMITISAWDWLIIKLDISALKRSGGYFHVNYTYYSDEEIKIECKISNNHGISLIKEEGDIKLQGEYFFTWADIEKQAISDVLKEINPEKPMIDIDKNVSFLIMDNEGMSAFAICEIHNGSIVWFDKSNQWVPSE